MFEAVITGAGQVVVSLIFISSKAISALKGVNGDPFPRYALKMI